MKISAHFLKTVASIQLLLTAGSCGYCVDDGDLVNNVDDGNITISSEQPSYTARLDLNGTVTHIGSGTVKVDENIQPEESIPE
ncbi:MAG: hypothetical protein LBR89_04005 [Holosporales bacterium]|jgi:hypothetical protein|nr:hypothetical protein [Holosporales bacterium]